MIDRYYERYGRRPMGVAADNTYGNGELLQWLDDRGITRYIRVKEGPNSPPDLYGIEKFTYVPEENCYLCPAGKPLNYVGINKRTLLTQTGGRRLHPHDHTAFIVDQIVIEVTQFGSAISLGQVRRIRVGGRHLVLLMDWLAIAVLLL